MMVIIDECNVKSMKRIQSTALFIECIILSYQFNYFTNDYLNL